MKNIIIIEGDTLIIRKARLLVLWQDFALVNVNYKAGRAQVLVKGRTVHLRRNGDAWTDRAGQAYAIPPQA